MKLKNLKWINLLLVFCLVINSKILRAKLPNDTTQAQTDPTKIKIQKFSKEAQFLLSYAQFIKEELSKQLLYTKIVKNSCKNKTRLSACDKFIKNAKAVIKKIYPDMRIYLSLSSVETKPSNIDAAKLANMNEPVVEKVKINIEHPSSSISEWAYKVFTNTPFVQPLKPISLEMSENNTELYTILKLYDNDTRDIVRELKKEEKKHLDRYNERVDITKRVQTVEANRVRELEDLKVQFKHKKNRLIQSKREKKRKEYLNQYYKLVSNIPLILYVDPENPSDSDILNALDKVHDFQLSKLEELTEKIESSIDQVRIYYSGYVDETRLYTRLLTLLDLKDTLKLFESIYAAENEGFSKDIIKNLKKKKKSFEKRVLVGEIAMSFSSIGASLLKFGFRHVLSKALFLGIESYYLTKMSTAVIKNEKDFLSLLLSCEPIKEDLKKTKKDKAAKKEEECLEQKHLLNHLYQIPQQQLNLIITASITGVTVIAPNVISNIKTSIQNILDAWVKGDQFILNKLTRIQRRDLAIKNHINKLRNKEVIRDFSIQHLFNRFNLTGKELDELFELTRNQASFYKEGGKEISKAFKREKPPHSTPLLESKYVLPLTNIVRQIKDLGVIHLPARIGMWLTRVSKSAQGGIKNIRRVEDGTYGFVEVVSNPIGKRGFLFTKQKEVVVDIFDQQKKKPDITQFSKRDFDECLNQINYSKLSQEKRISEGTLRSNMEVHLEHEYYLTFKKWVDENEDKFFRDFFNGKTLSDFKDPKYPKVDPINRALEEFSDALSRTSNPADLLRNSQLPQSVKDNSFFLRDTLDTYFQNISKSIGKSEGQKWINQLRAQHERFNEINTEIFLQRLRVMRYQLALKEKAQTGQQINLPNLNKKNQKIDIQPMSFNGNSNSLELRSRLQSDLHRELQALEKLEAERKYFLYELRDCKSRLEELLKAYERNNTSFGLFNPDIEHIRGILNSPEFLLPTAYQNVQALGTVIHTAKNVIDKGASLNNATKKRFGAIFSQMDKKTFDHLLESDALTKTLGALKTRGLFGLGIFSGTTGTWFGFSGEDAVEKLWKDIGSTHSKKKATMIVVDFCQENDDESCMGLFQDLPEEMPDWLKKEKLEADVKSLYDIELWHRVLSRMADNEVQGFTESATEKDVLESIIEKTLGEKYGN